MEAERSGYCMGFLPSRNMIERIVSNMGARFPKIGVSKGALGGKVFRLSSLVVGHCLAT
jgi:hypothetical protein